ncbi:MAG: helix-turn-helix domain-containing protein [Treponema sp.]|jgi:transcriptional regulator with XRE-family HTH domain|nr:helix-turn-helix domain-containing protein [Treponema sp.]
MDVRDFWSRVRFQKKKNKTTQRAIAKAIGISYNTFRGWIYKDIFPSVYDAYYIAKALDVTVEYLLTGKECREKRQKK